MSGRCHPTDQQWGASDVCFSEGGGGVGGWGGGGGNKRVEGEAGGGVGWGGVGWRVGRGEGVVDVHLPDCIAQVVTTACSVFSKCGGRARCCHSVIGWWVAT